MRDKLQFIADLSFGTEEVMDYAIVFATAMMIATYAVTIRRRLPRA